MSFASDDESNDQSVREGMFKYSTILDTHAEKERWDAQATAWKAENDGLRERPFGVARKAKAASTIGRRVNVYLWAKNMVEPLALGRAAMILEGKRDSHRAMALWLNDNGYVTAEGCTFNSRAVAALLYLQWEGLAKVIVNECRTRMAHMDRFVDFKNANQWSDTMETEYINLVKDAVILRDQLLDKEPLTGEALFNEARAVAQGVADDEDAIRPMTVEESATIWYAFGTTGSVRRVLRDRATMIARVKARHGTPDQE